MSVDIFKNIVWAKQDISAGWNLSAGILCENALAFPRRKQKPPASDEPWSPASGPGPLVSLQFSLRDTLFLQTSVPWLLTEYPYPSVPVMS